MSVSFEQLDGVGVIHLNRPPANSYDRGFLDELNAAIDEVRFREAVKAAVVVSDNPRFFSAGADIKMFLETSLDFKRAIILHGHEVLQKIGRTPKVFVAAVGGHCLGGGLEIALACDLRFGAEGEYRIGLPEANLGLLPGNGGTQRLSRLIGRNRALELMLSGEGISPARARELGVFDRLYSAETHLAETMAFAQSIADGPTRAYGNIKLATVEGIEMPLEAGLAWERQLVHELFATDDAQEGFSAFVEKRAASWKGR